MFYADYRHSHTQVVFVSNIATSHEKLSSKRVQPVACQTSQPTSNLIFCRSGCEILDQFYYCTESRAIVDKINRIMEPNLKHKDRIGSSFLCLHHKDITS